MDHRKLKIREAIPTDWLPVREAWCDAVASGTVLAYDEKTTEETAHRLWFSHLPGMSFVAELDGQFVGTYFVRPNQPGRGSHIATAIYLLPAKERGKGIGSALGEHSINSAWRLGFIGLQLNVVATNVAVVRMCEKLAFTTIGRLPAAFLHTNLGRVDVLVMFRTLNPENLPQLHRNLTVTEEMVRHDAAHLTHPRVGWDRPPIRTTLLDSTNSHDHEGEMI